MNKILSKLFKDSGIYGGADFLGKLFYFLSFPIIATYLNPRSYGVLEILFTFSTLIGIFIGSGMNNASGRFYWENQNRKENQIKIITSGIFVQLSFGLLFFFIGLSLIPIIYPFILNLDWPITTISLFSILAIMCLNQWIQYVLDVLRLKFLPWKFFILTLSSRVLSIGLGIFTLIFLQLGLDGYLLSNALILLILFPISLWMIKKELKLQYIDFVWLKKLLLFGYPFIFVSIAFWFLSSMDRWMLISLRSVDEVGIYSIAIRFSTIAFFASLAFGQAWSPIAMKIREDDPNGYRHIYGVVLYFLFFIMILISGLLALFSGELIYLMLPKTYIDAALPLVLLSIGIIFQSTQQITALGISIEKKTYLFARIAWVVTIFNFIGNLILIPSYGINGAATSTAASYLLTTVLYFYYTQRLNPIIIKNSIVLVLSFSAFFIGIFSIIFLQKEINVTIITIKISLFLMILLFCLIFLPLKDLIKDNQFSENKG